jgi:hypothetical protein
MTLLSIKVLTHLPILPTQVLVTFAVCFLSIGNIGAISRLQISSVKTNYLEPLLFPDIDKLIFNFESPKIM